MHNNRKPRKPYGEPTKTKTATSFAKRTRWLSYMYAGLWKPLILRERESTKSAGL
ncbi:hypothetical protein HMPREF1553_02192 [Porphyromonas gingivalis F0568]|nr:hypothetical protein HMPREF1553_02192 [Porphyromonas gingivalis F0568]